MGKGSCGDKRLVMYLYAVEYFVALLQTAQDGNGIFDGRFIDHDRLEAPLERGVLFDIFAVFVQGGRTDAVEFAAGEHGFEQVARIHRAFRFACTYYSVQFVYEENDPAFALFDLVEHGFQTLFKFSAELCAGDE